MLILITKKMLYLIRLFIFYAFRFFPIQEDKIFVQNFHGKGYADNPKYIAEQLFLKGIKCKIIWCVSDNCNNNFPNAIITVRYNSLKSIYEQVTAKVWINNCRERSFVRKRRGQYYIQTWHGGGPLKKIEKDAEKKLSASYVNNAKNDSKMADLFLSGSEFMSQLYRSVFWYNGEILECGSPRYDILVIPTNEATGKVRKYFSIQDKTKIILYAPTFRKNKNTAIYNLNYELILKAMLEHRKEKFIFLVRLHPNMTAESGRLDYSENVINASKYDDMQELLSASDILITDYSGCAIDFALMYKPVFLYIPDYEDYRKDRDLYFEISELPFNYSMNLEDLLRIIIDFDADDYLKRLNEFFKRIGTVRNGKASEKVAEKIIKMLQ